MVAEADDGKAYRVIFVSGAAKAAEECFQNQTSQLKKKNTHTHKILTFFIRFSFDDYNDKDKKKLGSVERAGKRKTIKKKNNLKSIVYY